MSVPGGERCIRRCLETGHTGAAMVVMSTEARTSKKAAIDRSEGSERGRSDQREFESFSPTSEDHTNANFVLYSHAKLGVEG